MIIRMYKKLDSKFNAIHFAFQLRRDSELSKAKLIELQNRLWVPFARHAVHNIPFYRDHFHSHGYNANQITDLGSIELFPFINKSIVQSDPDRFLDPKIKQNTLHIGHTSGTTGPAMDIWQSSDNIIRERVAILNQWRRVGYVQNQSPMLAIRARPEYLKNGSIINYDKTRNIYNISVFQLQTENIPELITLIQKQHIEYIHTYPSTAEFISTILMDNKKLQSKLSSLKALLLSSENLPSSTRDLINQGFNKRIFSHYGHAEHLILGGECSDEKDYHLIPRYGITEISTETEHGEHNVNVGELVGTSLMNRVMPLIRYRTGDFAEWQNNPCQCGLVWPRIKNVIGKFSSLQIIDNRNKKFNLSLILRVLVFIDGSYPLRHVQRFRFIQNEPGLLIMHYMAESKLNKITREQIQNGFNIYTQNGFKIEFKKVNMISLTRNGKHNYLIQNISL